MWIIAQKGGIFQMVPMIFDTTMKFISKFGYFKIFFAFLVKYPRTRISFCEGLEMSF